MSHGEEFREILKARARGPEHLGPLEPEMCERAMELILTGEATPAQISGFLLVGRAVGDDPSELAAYAHPMRALARTIEPPEGRPVVTVTGGFDGKLRTLNIGAAASLVAVAAGARVLMLGCEGTPPKEGRTVFEALRGLGVSPRTLADAEAGLTDSGFAAVGPEHYLPELHALLGLRWEMARRTALNVVEKLVSPIRESRMMVGMTHRPFLESIPRALTSLGVSHALVYQAIEGSDEAPLDGNSALVRVTGGEMREFRVAPESVGVLRATKAHIAWKDPEDEVRRVVAALGGEEGPVWDLILYNAALRLWMTDEASSVVEGVEMAGDTVRSGAALDLLERLRRPVSIRECPASEPGVRISGAGGALSGAGSGARASSAPDGS